MTSLQMTGIGPSIASNGGAQAVAPPATGGRSAPAAPGNRGWPSAGTDQTYGSGPTDLAVAPGGKAAAQHAPPGAGETSEAIGTQLILVFDDQTRSMKVKLLDIQTQKVDQQSSPDTASAAAQPSLAQAASAGRRVDTKA